MRQNPPKIIDPLHNFVDNKVSESNLGTSTLEQDSFVMGFEEIGSAPSNLEDPKRLGESALWNKLDGWVEQYKKDIEFWGIGSNPIFTVFRDSSGKVERVLVDEDEILRRSGIEPLYFREERESEVFEGVNSKIAHANFLAREMECGKDVISKHSSVVKFVSEGESSTFISRIRSLSLPPNLLPKVSKVGIAIVCGVVFVWAMKKFFTLGGDETEVSRFEKEMVRRKIKARMEKKKLQKSNVEVVEEPYEQPTEFMERPHIDKEKLLNSIREAKGLNNELPMLNVSGAQDIASAKMDAKIQEIQMMARRARKIEREESSKVKEDEFDEQTSSELPKMKDLDEEDPVDLVKGDDVFKIQASSELPVIENDTALQQVEDHKNLVNRLSDGPFSKPKFVNGVTETEILGDKEPGSVVSEENEDLEPQCSSSGRGTDDESSQIDRLVDNHNSSHLSVSTNGVLSSEGSSSQQELPKKVPVRRKPKIILSVREAREYLSKKQDQNLRDDDLYALATVTNEGMGNHTCERLEDGKAPESSAVNGVLDPPLAANICEFDSVKENGYLATNSNGVDKETHRLTQNRPSELRNTFDTKLNLGNRGKIDEMPKHSNRDEISDLVPAKNASHDSGNLSEATEVCDKNVAHDMNMVEKAYSQSEDSVGEANEIDEMLNPNSARKASAPAADGNDLSDFASEKNAVLLNKMSDDKASGKDNEEGKPLTFETPKGSESGRANKEGGPFTDKESWLEKNFHEVEPLVKKIGTGFRNNYMIAREKENEEMDIGFDFAKLRSMTDDTELEWMQDDKLTEIVFRVRDNELAGRDPFHSMDPEDKVAFFEGLERKVEKENEKLATLHQWLHSNIENIDYGADGISVYDPPEKVIPRWKGPPIDKIPEFLSNRAAQQVDASSLQMPDKSSKIDNRQVSEETSITRSRPKNKDTKTSKTLIEASDGSIKPGKKSGKEFWQHTKKLSPGFVESYNAETDPEVKSVMKDIGKDLDRWITEKEIQEAADVMDKIPQRGKEIIEKKLNKVKREMEMFGPAAVVSKYREYAEEKEEDYLWWLDLPYVLCIELYTYEGEEQKVGFYALEMATDLDINPKPNHVIAFEDPGDCKNLCYIIQAHLEMLGRGQTFVVAQTPKDAFREAKANGFGVTVIRKGELQLNIDQPLEEVEELISETGSKMYHDKLMTERSVDISALMKGVFGVSEPSKRRRKKRKLKRPSKP